MANRKRKEKSRRTWMVILLIIAMLAFIASQVPWDRIISKSSSKTSEIPTEPESAASANKQKDNTVFESEGRLTFTGIDGREKTTIEIEISDTEEERNLGLMHRRTLPDQAGMLFIFEKDKERNFWMKNTFLSLDFVFINSENKVANIKTNIAPMSEQGVPSEAPVKYVLELNAGFAEGYQLQIGDLVNIQLIN